MNNFSCKVCFEQFDRLRHKPHVLLNCTHTLCIDCIENLSEKKCPTCNSTIIRTNPNWEILDLMEDPDNSGANNNKLKNNVNRLINEVDCLKEEILVNYQMKSKANADKMKQLRSSIVAKTEEKIKQLSDCQKSLCNQTKTIEANLKNQRSDIINNVKENTNRYLNEIGNRINDDNKTLNETELNVILAELKTKKAELNSKNKQINKSSSEYIFRINSSDLVINEAMIGTIIGKQPQQVPTMMETSRPEFVKRDTNIKLKTMGSSVAVKGTPHEVQLKNYQQFKNLMLQSVGCLKAKQLNKAIEIFDKLNANILCSLNKHKHDILLDLQPNQMDTLLKKAHSLEELKQYDQAIETYNKAIELFPNEIKIFYSKACTLRELKRFEECIDVFDQAYRIDPRDNTYAHVKASAYASLGKLEQGIECIERALKSNRIQNETKRHMLIAKAEILRSAGRFEEAVKCLKICLSFDPNDCYVIKMLYYLKLKTY